MPRDLTMHPLPLTPRENILTVLRHEMPAWIPIKAHVDPFSQPDRAGMDPALAEALGDVQWGDGATRILSEHLGIDIMDYFSPSFTTRRRKVTVDYIKNAGRRTVVYHTPLGDLVERHQQAGEGGPTYCVEHLVKTGDDLPRLMALFEDEEVTPAADAAAIVQQRKAAIGDRGVIRSYMPGTPLGMMIRMYSGVETLAYLWADHRDRLHDLFRVMETAYRQRFSMAAAMGFDLLYGTDDTSTTTLSPAMFEEFCLGYTDRIADAVHAHGALYVHHSCGHIRHLLDLYRQTRMDAVDALNLAPPLGKGDIPTLQEARRRLGPRIAIIKGLPTGDGSVPGPRAAETIAAAFHDAAPGDNIIYGVGGQRTMAELTYIVGEARKHQRLATPAERKDPA